MNTRTVVTEVTPGEKEGSWTWIKYLNKDGVEKKTAIKDEEHIGIFAKNGKGEYALTWEKDGKFPVVVGVKYLGSAQEAAKSASPTVASTSKDLAIEAAVIFKGAVEIFAAKATEGDFRTLLRNLAGDYKDLLSGKLFETEKKEEQEVPF